MPKITKAHCPECKKQIKTKDVIEVTKTFTCPDCGASYIDQWDKESITCDNLDCYTSEKVLLIDIEIANHQSEVDKYTKQMNKVKPDKLKQIMSQLQSINITFRAGIQNRKEKDFDFGKVEYACYNCGEVLTREEWDRCIMTCIKCGEKQTKKVTRDKTVFKPVPSKHIVVCCPKFHILARYPNSDYES